MGGLEVTGKQCGSGFRAVLLKFQVNVIAIQFSLKTVHCLSLASARQLRSCVKDSCDCSILTCPRAADSALVDCAESSRQS